MTLLNVATGRTEAAILVDSFAPGCLVPSQKVYAVLPAGLLLARTGDAGHLLVVRWVREYLEAGILPGDPVQLAQCLPEVLRGLYRIHMRTGGMALVVAGMVDGEAHVCRYASAADFETERYAPGTCWVQPEPIPAPAPPSGAVPLDFAKHAEVAPPAVPPREVPFADQLATIITSADQQHRHHPDTVGGTAVLARIDADGIRLVPLFDFGTRT